MKNPGLYILTNTVNGMQYVGKDSNLPRRPKVHFSGNAPQCRHIHRAIKKYGADAFSVEIIQYPGISQEALNAVERWWIRRLQTLPPSGYNLTEGGEGVIPSEETRQKMSENASKRVEEGTHNLLGNSNPSHKRVVDGTHHFLDDEIQRRAQIKRDAVNKKRLEDGTHHLLDGEIQRRAQIKRIENGTHHFLDDEIQRRAQIKRDAVNKKRLEDGTHHLLDGEIQRRAAKKRIENGTHPFLDSEIQRQKQKKRIEEGTHNFLGKNHPMKRLSKEGRHPSTLKRLKGEWCYIIAVSRFYYEIHEYTLKRRAEFLSKDIPDTSNAEQEYLF